MATALPTEGAAESVNISSSGILIATETGLPVGVAIALQIAWPAKLDRFVPLSLDVKGRHCRAPTVDWSKPRLEQTPTESNLVVQYHVQQ